MASPQRDSGRGHTDREYEAQLTRVRNNLLEMVGHVEAMTAAAMRALGARDADLARATIARDAKVNVLEVETDELCLLILAKWQPMASDLRFVTLSLKMVTDIERIGDLAVNICERAVEMAETAPILGDNEDLTRMAELVQSMVHDAIDAFVDRDGEKARRVIASDDEVDSLYERVFSEILDVMRREQSAIKRGIDLQSVAKWLERMADHSTNLAEQVIFMLEGKDVRHPGKLG